MDISEFVADFVRTNTVNASVDQLWLTLEDKIQSTMEQYVPSKMTSSRFSQPWITGHLKRLARKKKRCYNKAKRSNSKDQWSKFYELKKQMQ